MTNLIKNIPMALAASVLVFGLAGCETMSQPNFDTQQPQDHRQSSYPRDTGYPRDAYSMYGTVQSVELIRQERSGSSIGVGTIAGAVVGGVVGNQIGSGRGNTAATVAGAAGGAYLGHQIENRNRQEVDAYRVTVRMENGGTQTLIQDATSDIRAGDRVRIENGVARRY